MRDHRPAPSARSRLLSGSACAGAGAFIILMHVGILPWRRVGRCRAIFCDPYHWQVLCFGIAIAAVGLLFMVPPRWPRIGRPLALVAFASFAAALVGTAAAM